MERLLTLKFPAPASGQQGIPLRFPWSCDRVYQPQDSNDSSTSEASSISRASSTNDSMPASIASSARLRSWRRMSHSLADAANMQTSVLPPGDYSQQSHQQ